MHPELASPKCTLRCSTSKVMHVMPPTCSTLPASRLPAVHCHAAPLRDYTMLHTSQSIAGPCDVIPITMPHVVNWSYCHMHICYLMHFTASLPSACYTPSHAHSTHVICLSYPLLTFLGTAMLCLWMHHLPCAVHCQLPSASCSIVIPSAHRTLWLSCPL